VLLIGLGLLLVGFGFKVAAVPFHMWAPDVYDGSPTPIAGYMATAVKAAAFAALFRVLGEAFAAVPAWHAIVWWLAVATMVVGNLIALAQGTLKRMLAYSSIAHAGYLLVAVATGTGAGAAAFLFYLVAYTLMTLAAFALLAAEGTNGERDVRIADLAGLAQRRPWLALALAVCMLSLLGFPVTAGFIGKWYILVAATSSGQVLLAAVLVLASVISAGYYLPVIMAMYMQPQPSADAHAGMRLRPPRRAPPAAAPPPPPLFWLPPQPPAPHPPRCPAPRPDAAPLPPRALYFATPVLEADGGVQVRGSHKPPQFNGFKVVLPGEAVAGPETQRLRRLIEDGAAAGRPGGTRQRDDAVLPRYRDAIAQRNSPLARRVKVVVDCGNGVSSVVAVDTLRQVGADVVPLFCESDGTFPNHHPDPTVVENLRDLQAAVRREHAELGIAFDGDGDRIGAVDEQGRVPFGDQPLGLRGRH